MRKMTVYTALAAGLIGLVSADLAMAEEGRAQRAAEEARRAAEQARNSEARREQERLREAQRRAGEATAGQSRYLSSNLSNSQMGQLNTPSTPRQANPNNSGSPRARGRVPQ